MSSIGGMRVDVAATQINFVYWSVEAVGFDHAGFQEWLRSQGIRIKPYDEDAHLYRFATHLHIRRQEVERIISAVRSYFEGLPQ
jgi:threonine aldolase